MTTAVEARPQDARHGADMRDRKFFVSLARAFAGALIFALPMLMTMEMWWIGFSISEGRLIVLILLLVPLLVGLSRFGGFKPTERLVNDVVDAFVAIAVAAAMAAVILVIFGVIRIGMPAAEVIGKVALQTVPGSIGAMLARAQLGGEDRQEREQRDNPTFGAELFQMTVGALFLGLNVAPTEEMVLLSYMMQPWQEVALALVSLALMHAFVYALEFRGGSRRQPGMAFWSIFLRYTVTGYAVVLLISLYLLWTFGQIQGTSAEEILSAAIVLGFPCAIGAAAARLIL